MSILYKTTSLPFSVGMSTFTAALVGAVPLFFQKPPTAADSRSGGGSARLNCTRNFAYSTCSVALMSPNSQSYKRRT